MINRALHTANAVKEVQGFAEVAQYLENKVERLQKRILPLHCLAHLVLENLPSRTL